MDLRDMRKAAGLSLDELGAKLGCDKGTLSRVERGGAPSARVLLALQRWIFEESQRIGVPLSELPQIASQVRETRASSRPAEREA